jgi:TatD DNase family protein
VRVLGFGLKKTFSLASAWMNSLKLADAHVHLLSYPDPEEVVVAADATGTVLLSCTVNPREAEGSLVLRRDHPETVRCFLGVHPSDAGPELPSTTIGRLFESADGVGEIGLDPKYAEVSPGGTQLKTFVDQLETAERLGKPVQVHSRDSERACLEILGSFRLRSVLMHWFEGESHLPLVMDRGYFVSVGPSLLYSKKLKRIASNMPLGSLLTESDGPVSFAVIGGRNGPSLIPSVLFCLSELKGGDFGEMADTLVGNLRRFLGEGT